MPRSHQRTLSVLAAAISTTLAGCYRFTPIEGTVPPSGVDVRVDLSDEGSVRLAPLIGPRIAAIDGRVVAPADTAIVLSVQAVVSQGGRSMAWSQERLAVPRSAVASLRTRQLDRKRTWLAAGLTVIGAIALGEAFGLGTGFDGLFGGIGGDGGRK